MSSEDPYSQCLAKYTVHPEAYIHVKMAVQHGAKRYPELGVEAARAQNERLGPVFRGSVDFPGKETEMTVPSAHVSTGIPITVYRPDSAGQVPAIVVYFHGGGFVLGNRASLETAVKTLSRDSGSIFVNVEYRLLPDPEAPTAPFQDALTLCRWVIDNKELVGGHAESKVGVGGDSAGGHISACVTNDVQDLDFQVLVYPMTDLSRSQESFKEFTTTPGLTLESIDWFFNNSIALIPNAAQNPSLNPMVRSNMATSPPAIIVLAELDPLRDCGLEYGEKLRKAGVPVECHVIKGVPHAFFGMCGIYKTKTAEAYAPIIEFLKKFNIDSPI